MGNAKGVIAIIFCLLMLLGMMVYSIIQICAVGDKVTLDSFFEGSFEKGQYVEGTVINAASEYASISHTVSFIPTGKEHFYIIFNEDYTKCAVVRADKDWDENFRGVVDGVEISGMVRKLDYEVQRMFSTDVASLSAEGVSAVTVEYYIDCLSLRYSIMSLAASLIAVLCGVVMYLNRHKDVKSPVAAVALVVLFADCVFAMHVLSMM